MNIALPRVLGRPQVIAIPSAMLIAQRKFGPAVARRQRCSSTVIFAGDADLLLHIQQQSWSIFGSRTSLAVAAVSFDGNTTSLL